MHQRANTIHTGIIAWFAKNHVAANLLMLLIFAFGVVSVTTIRKQTTPDFELNNVQIRVPYLGAAPQEVEEGVIIKIEEAIQDVEGITEINSVASEGMGTVTAKVSTGTDLADVLSEVKNRVDAISTFPALTEKPVISKQEVPIHVVFVSIYGDLDAFAIKTIAQQTRDELMAIPSVSQVEILGDRDYEISIEVSERVLREYGLTMSEVSQAIKDSSIDLPGGVINTEGGDILLRTEGQVYTGLEFGELVLRTYPDGTRLTLGEIANIKDGFVESDDFGRFNGAPTVMMRVLASGEQNELTTAADAKAYIEKKAQALPDGVKMDIWIDRSHYLQGRLRMMMKNMFQGAVLVFLILSLFLRLKVAFWVIIGIPITFFGAVALMPFGPWPVTINVISLFGFILVLGIVVDDAIIIGESIYTNIREKGHTLDNVISGAHRVAVPATFGVLTTMAAFAPMLFVGGIAGPFFEAMSVVVILCLFFSLIESKLILPAHLATATIAPIDETELFDRQHAVPLHKRPGRTLLRVQRRFQHAFHHLIHNIYKPALERIIDNRGVTFSVFIAVLILTVGLTQSGIVRLVLFPEVPGDFIQTNLTMYDGTATPVRNDALAQLESTVIDVGQDYVDDNPGVENPVHHVALITTGDTSGLIFVEMPLDENRPLNGDDITEMWRERLDEIPGVKELEFSDGDNIGGGAPLSFNLTGSSMEILEQAAEELEEKLTEYDGVFDIRNSVATGGQEIRLSIRPQAEALGLTMASLGRQVRQAFYGEEAQRIQRGKDELRVMVRYPREERRSVADLENMRIRTPDGDEVPFNTVAEISFGNAYSSITRKDRKQTVTVSADVDLDSVQPGDVITEISEEFMPDLLARYQGVSYSLEGSSREEVELLMNLGLASIAALFLIYALIAIPLHSYLQPLIIMSVIPFGFIGAVIGHVVMGKAISMFSIFGLIALAGVVVNDSLIMVDFINRARARGVELRQAVIESGTQRFRAIILTSLTTAAGLMPIMLEKSVQAQFVIPMAISLSFGIIFATVITLFLVPSLYLLQIDFLRRWRGAWNLLLGRDPEINGPGATDMHLPDMPEPAHAIPALSGPAATALPEFASGGDEKVPPLKVRHPSRERDD